MSSKQEIAASLDEAWRKLSARWKGEDPKAFYQQYITKMTEAAENFDRACSDLSAGAADLSKKLERIEHDMT